MTMRGHSDGDHGSVVARDKTSLVTALGITVAVFLFELIGGILSNSLALIADATHMFTDIVALALSLFALWLATQPAPPQKTYGYYRTEILAALANGVLLVLVALSILYEAFNRFGRPERVDGQVMLGVALVGLAANVASAFVLSGHVEDSLNIKAAFAHVISDATASIGTVVAGIIILATGATVADPAIGVLIAVLIMYNAWRLVMESVDVLMEAAPGHINLKTLEETILKTHGVRSVHDLHVWTVTSGLVSMSGHVVVDQTVDRQTVLEAICSALAREFGLTHCTLQLELEDIETHKKHYL
ncbi:MAG: cation transporter [Chloroflexi bacterium]|nr:cation transporter [Chloroflexota bacterium]